MSTLAMIFVFQCDGCPRVQVCKDTESHEKFQAEWHDMTSHFCPDCQLKDDIAAKIEVERAKWKKALERYIDRNLTTPEAAYVH